MGMLLIIFISFSFWKLLACLNSDYRECLDKEFEHFGYSDELYNFALWLEREENQ